METSRDNGGPVDVLKSEQAHSAPLLSVSSDKGQEKQEASRVKTTTTVKRGKRGKRTESKKGKEVKHESSSEDSASGSSSSDSSEDSNKDERERRRLKKKRRAKVVKEKEKKRAKTKAKKRKSKKYESSSEDSDSNSSSSSPSDSESESDTERRRRKKKTRKTRKWKKHDDTSDSSSNDETPETTPATSVNTIILPAPEETEQQLMEKLAQLHVQRLTGANPPPVEAPMKKTEGEAKEKKTKKGRLEYKRVDQIWDQKSYDWKYNESVAKPKDECDSVFTVRRKFNYENQYDHTVVDIKSNLLQDVLKVVMKDVKGQSLVEETPAVDPNLLFMYYDELKAFYKKTLKKQLKREKNRKHRKRLIQQIAQCKLLVDYIDKDYTKIRKRLEPMLQAGTITFDLIWALFKPNTFAYTPTYGNKDDPRCFKVDYAFKEKSFMNQEWWSIEGRYLEYNGKIFGLGEHSVKIDAFKGPRKITSLDTYPMCYHKDPEGLRKTLIERGKKFVALQGMNYRFHVGLAYQKVKRTVVKHTIDGRVMVDPAIFRRINPNYPLSYIRLKEDEMQDEDNDCDCSDSDSSASDEDSDEEGTKVVVYKDKKGKYHLITIPAGSGADLASQKLDSFESEDGSTHTFSEEELLIASPVVLGFAFSVKHWLEFSLSGIREIEWNSDAFDSLVLPQHVKQNLRGLVKSHRFNAAKTIDDVIQGKGKGLNVVLHGPPGVGKTLTGESIADFLKCPLYAVSAGELGTNSRALEADLNRIMDITHSWGAILLLDEADVFLEQRQAQDIHRNSLVSVFLRLLEYYQGILFLTTNRVATFDEAFQSRIHMGIRYENLTNKARKEIWQHHVKKIEAMENQSSVPFTDVDYNELSKKTLNGRQIKNTISTAQSIALAEEDPFSVAHVKRVLDTQEEFEVDMKGGTGYRDAMRHYT